MKIAGRAGLLNRNPLALKVRRIIVAKMQKLAEQGRRAQGEKTRHTILDAAEELFGDYPYDAVSLRDVAQRAGVQIGLLSYHFKTKEKLFEAVMERRAQEANAVELAELRKYENPSLEQIVDAFFRPTLQMARQPKWRNYFRVTLQNEQSQQWRVLRGRLFAPTLREFHLALEKAMPGTSPKLVVRGFMYMVSIMMSTAQNTMNVRDFSQDYPDELDDEYHYTVCFVAGGMRAMALSEYWLPVSEPNDQKKPKRPVRIRG